MYYINVKYQNMSLNKVQFRFEPKGEYNRNQEKNLDLSCLNLCMTGLSI